MIGTVTLLTLLVVVSGLGFLCNQSLQAAFNRAVNYESRRLILSAEVSSATSEMMLGQTRFVLLTLQNDPDASDAARQSVHANSSKAMDAAKRLSDSMTDPQDKQTVDQLTNSLAAWNGQFGEMEKSLAADNIPAAMAANDQLQPLYKNICSQRENIEHRQSAALQADTRAASIRGWAANVVTGLALLIAVVMGTIVIRIVRTTNSTLRELSTNVANGGEQIAAAASQISHASQQLATQASQQSAALHETTTSTRAVLNVVRQNSNWAKDAVALTGQTEQRVLQGDSLVQQLAVHMKSIAEAGRKIAVIVNAVEEIAFQTKILSLNAAIEAAHAGDAGAGFSVVATEVKTLAERCSQAARDSEELLNESAGRTSNGVKSIEAVQVAIREIANQCGGVKSLISQIDSGTREQSESLAQIDGAISELEVVTSSVAATAEQSASMAEEFTAQSETLRSVVQRLSGFVDGQLESGRSTHSQTDYRDPTQSLVTTQLA